MADVETVRTVFKTEWLGAGAVQNMIRQYGMAKKAMDSLGATGAGGGNAAFSKTAQFTRKMSEMQAGLIKELDAGNISATQAEKAWSGYGTAMKQSLGITAEASAATGVMGTGLSVMTVALGAAVAGVAALALGFKALYPVLAEGADIAQLNQSFEHLNLTMNDSPGLLRDMKEASRGTLTTMAAQEGFMTLVAGSSQEMTQALADAAPKILEISKAANKLNPALGTTNFMFTSLAKGLKRAEPRLIDNLGLKLRVSDANREMADELGKSVMALTAEEKQMAILNETLKAGEKLIQQVGGNVDGLGDSFLRVDSATTDFKNSMKSMLAAILDISGANDAWAGFLNMQTDLLNEQEKLRRAWQTGVITYKEYAKALETQTGIDNMELEIDRRIIAMEKERVAANRAADAYLKYQQLVAGVHISQVPGVVAEVGGSGVEMGDRRFGSKEQRRAAQIRQNRLDAADVSLEEAEKALKEEEKLLNESIKNATAWADSVEEASQKARDAWKDYERGLVTTTSEHIKAKVENSLFTTSINDIGDGFRTTGGATAEQADQVERLTKKLERAKEKAADFALGIGSVGMTEETIGKKTEKYAGEIVVLENALGMMNIAETETIAVHQKAVWSWDKVKTALFDAADAADLSVDQYARVGIALGEVTAEQAAAGLETTAMGAQMSAALEKVRLGEIAPEDILAELEKAAAYMREHPIEALLTPKYEQDTIAERGFGDDDELDRALHINIPEDELLTLWKERMLGLEEEPPVVAVMLEMNEAQTALDVFWSENGEMWVQVHMEEWELGDIDKRPRIGGRAGGGNALRDTPIIVGEQGPEIIVPGSNSTVLPTDSQSGNNIEINLNVTGGGSDDLASVVEDVLLEAMQQVGLV